jgi:hypothetical protein
MRGKKTSEELKKECIRLRIEDHLSFNEIFKKSGVAKGTLSALLKNYPLSKKVVKEKIVAGLIKLNKMRNKREPFFLEESKYYKMIKPESLSRHDKAKIAESAILFRLCLLKFIVYGSPFDGDKADWLIENQNNLGKTKRIQVRWVKQGKMGLPLISLVCIEHGKQKRFQKGDFDFIVGYCLKNDTAYIYSYKETEHLKTAISVSEKATEAWNKLN